MKNLLHDDIGTNQYQGKSKRRDQLYSILALIAVALFVATIGRTSRLIQIHEDWQPVQAQAESIQYPVTDPVRAYIREVFGKDYDKAMKLLSCENPRFNPKAVNRNWTKDQPGQYWSSDLGLFQLNDHFQGVTNKGFLFDYKINTDMAKNIYDAWGHNFHAWTCGSEMNI